MQVKEVRVLTVDGGSFVIQSSESKEVYIQFFDHYFVVSAREGGVKKNTLVPLHAVLNVDYH